MLLLLTAFFVFQVPKLFFFFFSMVCRGMRGEEKNPTNTQQQVLIIFQGDFVVAVLQNNPFGYARSHPSPFASYISISEKNLVYWYYLESLDNSLWHERLNLNYYPDYWIAKRINGFHNILNTEQDNCLFLLKLAGRTGTASSPFANPRS